MPIFNRQYIENEKIVYSLVTGIAVTLSVYIVLRLHLNAPYWSAISVVAICSPGVGITISKGLMRIVATFFGALLGLYFASLTVNHFYGFVVCCFLVFTISQYLSYCTKYKYIFVLGAATFFMVHASLVNDISNIYYIAVWRFSEVSIGVFVASMLILLCFNENVRALVEDENVLFFGKQSSNNSKVRFFTLRKEAFIVKESIKNGLGVILALFLWMTTASPGGLQGLVSALAISQPKSDEHNISTVLHQAKNRFLGCLAGGLIGLTSLALLQFNLPILLMTLFIGTSFFAYIALKSHRYSYLGFQANIAFILTIVQTDLLTTSIVPAITRLSGVCIGIFSIMVVHLLIWPRYKNSIVTSAN